MKKPEPAPASTPAKKVDGPPPAVVKPAVVAQPEKKVEPKKEEVKPAKVLLPLALPARHTSWLTGCHTCRHAVEAAAGQHPRGDQAHRQGGGEASREASRAETRRE